MARKLIISISLFTLILVSSCFVKQVPSKHNIDSELIPYLWKIDSCGDKGFRLAIHDLFFFEQQINLSEYKDIVTFLPHPNKTRIDTSKKQIIYSYIIEGGENCQYPNEWLLWDMTVIVDVKTEKVKRYYSSIY